MTHKVSIQMQELELQTNLFALPHKEIDIVLGSEWLMQLGIYTTNLGLENNSWNLVSKDDTI